MPRGSLSTFVDYPQEIRRFIYTTNTVGRDNRQLRAVFFSKRTIEALWDDLASRTARWKQIGIELLIKEEERTLFYERKAANEVDMCVWAASSEFSPLIDPRWFIPYSAESNHAIEYAKWWNSGGKEGEEPTGDLRKALELYDEIKVTPSWEKQVELFHEILKLNEANLWAIGISTAPPQLVIAKNSFRNVPEKGNSDWHLLSPGSTACEQYFIQQS